MIKMQDMPYCAYWNTSRKKDSGNACQMVSDGK